MNIKIDFSAQLVNMSAMGKRNITLVVITTAILVIAAVGGWLIIHNFVDGETSKTAWWSCQDQESTSPCVRDAIKQFHDVDYSESKDLAKSFLTLLVAVFVASVTFSEKIVDLKTSGRVAVVAMFVCWLLLIIAIVTCGIGLCYITFALYQATYGSSAPYALERDAGIMFLLSGGAFVCSLLAMFTAALPSLFPKSTASSSSDGEV